MASIIDLWRQGENSAVEFKSASARPESLAKEMVAFANTEGGAILLGVEDDGRVGGLGTELDYEGWAANIARNNVVPALDVQVSLQSLEGRDVLLIEVPKGRDKPYQTRNNQFLVRIGSTNRVATQQELMRLFQQAGVFHYDLTPVERTSMRSLDLGKIDAYFQRYDVDFEHDDDREGLLINTDSYAVNPVLLKFMENLRFIDKLGRGLPMVYREAVTHGRRVVFEEVGEEFRVTLGLNCDSAVTP